MNLLFAGFCFFMGLIRCKKCGVEKPENLYTKRSDCSTGHRLVCKECERIRNKNRTMPIRYCSVCGDESYSRKPLTQTLCEKHYRFKQMIECSIKTNKYTPSNEELESLDVRTNMICPVCGIRMKWRTNNLTEILTLQHNDDGSICFLCQPCNSRAKNLGDNIYSIGLEYRRCICCLEYKKLDNFCYQNKYKSSFCKKCSNLKNRKSNRLNGSNNNSANSHPLKPSL